MPDAVAKALAAGAAPKDDSTFRKIARYLVNDSIPAQAVKSAWSGLTLPGDVYYGKADPYDYGRALDFAGMLTLGAGAVPAGENELRAGVQFFPGVGDVGDEGFKNLRQRYSGPLNEAVNYEKDVNRIKLTPSRVEAAKDALASSIGRNKRFRQALAQNPTEQMQQAQQFAKQMAGAGEDVRFKIPNGDTGSLYVRVGDKGTVRFADHPQPTDWVGSELQTVGGYSKELGRRHYPATYSVSPKEMSLDDILNIFIPKNEI